MDRRPSRRMQPLRRARTAARDLPPPAPETLWPDEDSETDPDFIPESTDEEESTSEEDDLSSEEWDSDTSSVY